MTNNTALIVVDVQNDFVEGGALGVTGGKLIASRIADYIDTNRSNYEVIVFTHDWHINPGSHFADEPDFIDSWPVHCVAETDGASLVPVIASAAHRHIDKSHRLHKGEYEAAYSAFDGHMVEDENRTLDAFLKANNIQNVEVVGIATDYCVKETAVKSVEHGYHTTVIADLTVGIAEASIRETETVLFPRIGVESKHAYEVNMTADELSDELTRRTGWFDGEFVVPSDAAVAVAHDILTKLEDQRVHQPTLYPNVDGGVRLGRFDASLYWSATIAPDGSTEISVTDVFTNETRVRTCVDAAGVVDFIQTKGEK